MKQLTTIKIISAFMALGAVVVSYTATCYTTSATAYCAWVGKSQGVTYFCGGNTASAMCTCTQDITPGDVADPSSQQPLTTASWYTAGCSANYSIINCFGNPQNVSANTAYNRVNAGVPCP